MVYPLEFWKRQTPISYEYMEKQVAEDAHNLVLNHMNYMLDLFENIKNTKNDTYSFMKSLRNAISHSHVELSSKQDKFTIWDVNQKTGKNILKPAYQ